MKPEIIRTSLEEPDAGPARAPILQTTSTSVHLAPEKNFEFVPPLPDIDDIGKGPQVADWVEKVSKQAMEDEKKMKEEVISKMIEAAQKLGNSDADEISLFPTGIKLPTMPFIREPGPVESKLLYSSYLQVESENLDIWYIEYFNIIHTIDQGLQLIEQQTAQVDGDNGNVPDTSDSDSSKQDEVKEQNLDEVKLSFEIIKESLTPQKGSSGGLLGGRWREDNSPESEANDLQDIYKNVIHSGPDRGEHIYHIMDGESASVVEERLPGSDGAGRTEINLEELDVFKGIPESMIKYLTPQAKYSLLNAALREKNIFNVRKDFSFDPIRAHRNTAVVIP